MNTCISIAEEIYRSLSEPSDISSGSISLWLKDAIGSLNNLILTDFSIDTASGNEIIPALTDAEKSIIKKLYLIHYYTVFVSKNLGAASYDSVIEVDSDGAKVRLVNKNEIAKTYIALRKDETEELNKLITGYKNLNGIPLAIHGDDYISADASTDSKERNC
ncbi:MAG: hypothetical protein AABY22_15375 [Nanoarchaeota archaeon]